MHMKAEFLNIGEKGQTSASDGYFIEDILIRHAIPGRMRVKVSAIRSLQTRAHYLQVWLSGRREIIFVEARSGTGSVILEFDPGKIGYPAMLELVLAGVWAALAL
jgi:hypothetical protein